MFFFFYRVTFGDQFPTRFMSVQMSFLPVVLVFTLSWLLHFVKKSSRGCETEILVYYVLAQLVVSCSWLAIKASWCLWDWLTVFPDERRGSKYFVKGGFFVTAIKVCLAVLGKKFPPFAEYFHWYQQCTALWSLDFKRPFALLWAVRNIWLKHLAKGWYNIIINLEILFVLGKEVRSFNNDTTQALRRQLEVRVQ